MAKIISQNQTSLPKVLQELWNQRELFYFLVWRDIALRYKQTIVGVVWVVLQPVAMTIVFTFLFGNIAKIPTGSIPYPLFVYPGLMFWNFFTRAVSASSESIVANRNLIEKVYFPRLVLPLAATIVNLVDFLVSFLVFTLLLVYFQFSPNLMGFLFLPLALVVLLIFTAGLGAFLASLNVFYRDIRFIIPFALQILLFLTPIVYPANLVGNKYTFFLKFNPLAAIIESAREAFFGSTFSYWPGFGLAALVSLVFFGLGIGVFLKSEKYFADIV
ncbi:MAG: ABC-2 type transporter [Candidatus Gottesmanbacteria bacterium GW2011_GWB1_43_11]|uniref:Transport permease protein n=1 Tax=Candidatus Gottesmanbacteria bacterium GW2011_GWB1_43_11 TaxID=1618446 RepID=A0A0G1CNJ6_9BACT|nr:MAG: ABC-2 type transporter [Candidatus Gottesmanbacteria bacterium GW2011_GWA2_42_16]KKS80127.1 MAG: ABC-2 type transporter [Candidatus Gottesmanbacteria bacterium GW2011_GWC1_43_10]KKS87077.1 MAG: ABC-2 type transporter [Candidatus Gottesmanbacteria bacterium GW2011_GWB1_43_11]OGG10441.1 MAG: hypothetical protein A2699_05200 [Candidatus Gottesmanbacteria bacterium RIFCSPHIGHO2_01_FULL_43_15]OGG28054.1 MAG: hypothetical protein A3A59_02420 [Candidatus Gottesmanbacteria bacterium RIFCSPLOWO2